MKKAITITNSKIIINKKVFERMCEVRPKSETLLGLLLCLNLIKNKK